MTRCRSCDAPIVWATTPSGRKMPLSAVADGHGNVRLRSDGVALVVALGEGSYVSHFATCPQAAQHRRRP